MTVKTHRYEPRGSARTVLESRAKELLVSGAAGTGKSRACLTKVMAVACKYDESSQLIIRKTAASLGSTALVTWRRQVVPELLSNGKVYFYGGSAEEPPQYRFWNGSKVMIGGMDKPDKIMSSEYDLIYAQEATELNVTDWELATSRLRNGVLPYQQMLADCNPNVPTHFLKVRADEGKTTLLTSVHEENPRLFQWCAPTEAGAMPFDSGWVRLTRKGREYIERLDALTGVRYLRLRKGLWVAAEGLIYENFNPAVHLVDGLPKGSEGWTRYWAVDFGFVHPFVLQCWAEDPDGRLWLYREIYRTRRLVEDHAKDIMEIVAPGGVWKEPKPTAIICDHDAEDRATLEKHLGMGTTPAKKTVSDGLQATEARLRVQGDGRPRLYVVRGATVHRDASQAEAAKPCSTEEEFPGYVWANSKTKEAPVKEDDDGMDATRYIVANRDLTAEARVRWL